MVEREDIVFATCHQLAQLIADDWDSPPSAISEAISMLKPIDEPGEIFYAQNVINLFKLSPSETEPKSIREGRKLLELAVVLKCFNTILAHSDGWETKDSDVIKKEIISRIADYEKETKNLVAKPERCHISI